MIITSFAIFKQEPKNDKSPTHVLSAKIGDDYVNIGSAWTKDGTKGKFLSCQLSKAWISTTDSTKSQRSYVIVAEEDLKKLQDMAGMTKVEEPLIDPTDGRDLSGDTVF